MGKFTVIPQETFNDLANPHAPRDADIITATTGGINATLEPTYSDFGEDVDNCPVNMKELKHLDYWTATMAFTALGSSAEAIALSIGAADITETSTYDKVVPRRNLNQTDFQTVWWVGDLANGGAVAVEMLNALSTGGFGLQTTKSAKGQLSVTLTGHVSINSQNVVPMNFYVIDPDN